MYQRFQQDILFPRELETDSNNYKKKVENHASRRSSWRHPSIIYFRNFSCGKFDFFLYGEVTKNVNMHRKRVTRLPIEAFLTFVFHPFTSGRLYSNKFLLCFSMKKVFWLELGWKMELGFSSLNTTTLAPNQHYEVSPLIFYQLDYGGEVKPTQIQKQKAKWGRDVCFTENARTRVIFVPQLQTWGLRYQFKPWRAFD